MAGETPERLALELRVLGTERWVVVPEEQLPGSQSPSSVRGWRCRGSPVLREVFLRSSRLPALRWLRARLSLGLTLDTKSKTRHTIIESAMNAAERQRLIALYKSWSEEELAEALIQREDYRPESIELVKLELARRKIVPVAPNAIFGHVSGFDRATVKLSREGLRFPPICPHCLQHAACEVQVSHLEFEALYGIYITWKKLVLTVPFCREFAAKYYRAQRIWKYGRTGIIGVAVLLATTTGGDWTAILVLAVALSGIFAIPAWITRPDKFIRIVTFDASLVSLNVAHHDYGEALAHATNASAIAGN